MYQVDKSPQRWYFFLVALLVCFISEFAIFPQHFLCFTFIKLQEPCPFVGRLFLDKMHKLLKEHSIPSRYACAYALAASDHCKDLQDAVCFCPLFVWFLYKYNVKYYMFSLTSNNVCWYCLLQSFKYIEEFIKEYSRKAQIRQTSGVQESSPMDYPAYIVVFLIHVLAHDAGFPPDGCQDEQVYAQFCRWLIWSKLSTHIHIILVPWCYS